MIARVVLAGLLVLAAPALDDCGGPPPKQQQQQVKKKPDGCPPAVMWMQPNYGTVTKTKTCTGFFGTTVRYAYVDGDIADGWVADYTKLCGRGDNWVGGSGCG